MQAWLSTEACLLFQDLLLVFPVSRTKSHAGVGASKIVNGRKFYDGYNTEIVL